MILTNPSNTGPAAGTLALDSDIVLLSGVRDKPKASEAVVVCYRLHDRVALLLS